MNGVKFKAYYERDVFRKDDFAIVAMRPEKCSEEVKLNKYGNVTVKGNFPILSEDILYTLECDVENSPKYGLSYSMTNFSVEQPTTEEETYKFLVNILSYTDADTLFLAYPNIIEMVKDGKEPDLSKLKGIKEKKWHRIKNKIMENTVYFDVIGYFDGALSINAVKKIFDKYKNIEIIKSKIKEDPYYFMCSIDGIGFKKADAILLRMKDKFNFDLRTSKQRCRAAISHVIKEMMDDGSTKMLLVDCKAKTDELVPECCKYFKEIVGESKKDKHSELKLYVDEDHIYVTLKSVYDSESFIVNSLLELEGNKRTYSKLFDKVDMSKYNKLGDFEATDEQKGLLQAVIDHNVVILDGNAGSGKSATISLLVKMLEDNHVKYMLASPTGKAAKVLQNYTMRQASTIHMMIAYNNFDCDVLILDECSMIDTTLMNMLLGKMLSQREFLPKLVFVGDDAQLPSVGYGNVFYDIINTNRFKTVHLSKIFRYSSGGLMKVATDIRNKKRFLPKESEINKTVIFGDEKDYMFVKTDKEKILNDTLSLYKGLIEKGELAEDIMVLTPYRKGDLGCTAINNLLQKIVNPRANDEREKKVSFDDKTFYEGDIVLQTVNNYTAARFISEGSIEEDHDDPQVHTFIANGETGRIKKIYDKYQKVIIEFPNSIVIYDYEEMKGVDLGYSITIHKSQGSSSKYVILLSSSSHTYMLNNNLLYTGITRTKHKCIHIGEVKTVNRAVRIKEENNRKTNMFYLLNNIERD